MSGKSFTIGTRGSALALTQSAELQKHLGQAHPGLCIAEQIIHSIGDKQPDIPLSTVGVTMDKGFFTSELEVVLAKGGIHCAVHSLKDMPTELAEGFTLAAILPREEVGEVVITKDAVVRSINDLPESAEVATSSLRRQRQLLQSRPDLICSEIRGNVPTRLRKLSEQDELVGLVLAKAGLRRLGFDPDSGVLRSEEFGELFCFCPRLEEIMPACGQGAIAVEVRSDDLESIELLQSIDDRETRLRVEAEREFLHLLGAGCQTPVGVITVINKGQLEMKVRVFDEGNMSAAPREAEGSAASEEGLALAAELADKVLSIK